MSSPPPIWPPWRYPRVHLDGKNPVVLRFPDGHSIGANLEVISFTGGLVSLSKSVDQGSRVRLMFLTQVGSVFGGAEMLAPVSERLQPFRFNWLPADDQRRLGALIGERLQNKSELAWIEKLRNASAQCNKPPRSRFKLAGVFGLLAVGLAAAAYLLSLGLLK